VSELVTIDGPSGAGKGTLAKSLSRHYGFRVIDSGILYRRIAERAMRLLGEPFLLAHTLVPADLEDSPDLRTIEVEARTAVVAMDENVRQVVNSFLRKVIAEEKGCVLDGRDGAREFPEASTKIFLEAELETRVKRRYFQLRKAGKHPRYLELLEAMRHRDKTDREREFSPLRPAPGAVVIDCTRKSAQQVLDAAVAICEASIPAVA
jgi:CMP/dCMP kinase